MTRYADQVDLEKSVRKHGYYMHELTFSDRSSPLKVVEARRNQMTFPVSMHFTGTAPLS